MDKKQFMSELRQALGKVMPEHDFNEILEDYEEFFDAGLAEGRSEAEVAHHLGDPSRIVLSLLEKDASTDEYGDKTLLPYAPLGNRLIAFFIDSVLALFPLAFFGVANVLFLMPFIPVIVLGYAARTTPTTASIALAWVFLAYAYLYQPFFLVLLGGQTPGKRLMKIEVVKEDGSPINAGTAVLREVLGKTIIYSVTFGVGSLISFLWSLFSKEHKTIPDVIAGTRVVASKRGK